MPALALALAVASCAFGPASGGSASIAAANLGPLPHGQFYRVTVLEPERGIAEYNLNPGEGEGVPLYFRLTAPGAYSGEVGIVKNHGGPNHLAFQDYTLLATCATTY